MIQFNIGDIKVGTHEPFFILGPCGLEDEDFAWRMARALKEITTRVGVPFIFKASYDKANRTSVDSYRGPGVKEGCRILGEIGKELGVPVTTDIHTPEECEIAAEHIDLLQIPAFLCRQTDLLAAAAQTKRPVNVKKGQFLAPWDIHEQGVPVIFDATHSVQRPGGLGGTTGGDGVLAPVLARSAVAAGVDGVFMEVHENPEKALSDGPNQIPLDQIESVLTRLMAVHQAAHSE